MPQHHVSHPRGSDVAPRSHFVEGRFGRMFRNLPSFEPPDTALRDLAGRMLDSNTPVQPADSWSPPREPERDSEIPAGYTYLGQFIDHDITFDPASSLQRQNDPDALHNFRTPRFDLDSLYGAGPNNDPFMYDPAIDDGRTSLLIGANTAGAGDLPRNLLPNDERGDPQGRALIGDPRNDENIIVSQLHLLFMRFHNKVVELVKQEQPGISRDDLFEEAQRIVRWHYQWVVIHDFLPRIVGGDVVADILEPHTAKWVGSNGENALPNVDLRFFRWHRQPYMPVEFSVAAYRFGHSMIRPTYKINAPTPDLPIFSDQPDPARLDDFRGFRPLPHEWPEVDWSFFFESNDESNMQVARMIDAQLALGTFHLPGGVDLSDKNLAFRNLRRGARLGLPSGQRVARAMGVEPLDDAALGITDIDTSFAGNAPLWFYVLREAETAEGGKLGPVGGRIVAEVLVGLLKGDHLSYLNVQPNWKPSLADDGEFGMAALVDFVKS